jgi:UDP-N-acetylmuramoyl-tripeptide--D-alanyl-D-alanine ligase
VAQALEFFWEVGELSRRFSWEIRMGRSSRFNRIVTDTRILKPDPEDSILFVALPGKRTDGHQYVSEAIRKGAQAVLVRRGFHEVVPDSVTVIAVPDTRLALGDLARLKVERYRGRILAITGSSGKTTTKYLLKRMLGQGFMAPGNLNNDIGVPLSIFSAPLSEPYWIFELGMNAKGEIAYLASILKPQVALLLPAGYAHIGLLGSKRAILEAKAELLTTSPPEIAILSSPRYLPFLSSRTSWVAVYPSPKARRNYLPAPRSEFFVRSKKLLFPRGTEVIIQSSENSYRFTILHLIGSSFAIPVALACAGSVTLTGAISENIIELEMHDGRMRIHSLGDRWFLDDSYNASPESFFAFVETLREIQRMAGLRLYLLLGEMKELGRFSLPLHRLVVRRLKGMRIEWLGALGEDLIKALKVEGIPFQPFSDPQEGITSAWKALGAGSLLALKGAHATGIYGAFQKFLSGLRGAL